MSALERLKTRTSENDEQLLADILESAASIIMSRRYPYGEWPEKLEKRYEDLQVRIAIEIYNRIGAEGQVSHSENGINRSWDSSWVSNHLLQEIVPKAGLL